MSRRVALVGVLVLALLAGLAIWWGTRDSNEEAPVTGTVSDTDLRAAAQTKVFFGHQSVGMNIIDGIPGAYAGSDIAAPTIVQTDTPPAGIAFAHSYVGANGDPAGKLADMRSLLAAGFGDWADVALVKFCYVDITAGTDVQALFEEYQQAVAAAEQAYPDTRFLYLTVPLTTPPNFKDRVKGLLGRPNSAADNAARERYNSLVRAKYAGTGRLFDIAAIESTLPDGSRVSGTSGGQPYFALYPGYAADEGHLTPAASTMVAEQLLATIAAARDQG